MRIFLLFNCLFSSLLVFGQIKGFEPDDMGIMVEKFDPSYTNENRYTEDNGVYKQGKKIYYSIHLADKNNKTYYLTKLQPAPKDSFVITANKTDYSLKEVQMTVLYGLKPMSDWIKGFNQTLIQYDFILCNGDKFSNEITGLIENEKNIWLHPPRTDYFKILELNPFPYIKLPLKHSRAWEWTLNVGSHWSDKRWLQWTGQNQLNFQYKIVDKLLLDTKLGKLECYKVQAEASSVLGKTSLVSYYNTQKGFVKLEYTNIDGSRIIFELNKITE